MIDIAQIDSSKLEELDADRLRELIRAQLEHSGRELAWRDAKIDKLPLELAQLKRLKFDRAGEQMNAEQRALFNEAVDGDIAALDEQLAALQAASRPADKEEKKTPKRNALPDRLPRREARHELKSITRGCDPAMKRVGEDISEKLDYQPGEFSVERHVRGCTACRTPVQAPVPPAVIDKGIPTAGLLAQVVVAKHADRLPLYRQEAIFGWAGLAIPRSTLGAWIGQCGARLLPLAQALKVELLGCQVLHADEPPVAMLALGKGKTQRAYLWAYTAARSEILKTAVYDFAPSRSGEHMRVFLGHDPRRRERDQQPWSGHMVCNDFSGCTALSELGITEVGCLAHARRKFVELHFANKSGIAAMALDLFGQLYQVERDIQALTDPAAQLEQRRSRAAPIAQTLLAWLIAQRVKIPSGTAMANSLDYSLNRWVAPTRYLHDARLPIDNNRDEQQIRSWGGSCVDGVRMIGSAPFGC